MDGPALLQGLILVGENHKCPLTDMDLFSKICLLQCKHNEGTEKSKVTYIPNKMKGKELS